MSDRPNILLIVSDQMTAAVVDGDNRGGDERRNAYAAERSIRLGVVNHTPFIMLSYHQAWVVKLVGMSNVGACMDTGSILAT